MARPSNSTIRSILSGGQFALVGLYDITLATGQSYHFSDGDDATLPPVSILTPNATLGPFTYSLGFAIKRGNITQKVGAEAGHMDVHFSPGLAAPTVAGYPIQQAARYGFLDGALLRYSELYLDPAIAANSTAVGYFQGRIQDVEADALGVQLTVDDFLAYLGNQQMPRLLWQTGCFHEVYDAGCTLLKSTFTVSGTVTSVGDQAHFVASAMTQPTGYFKLGVLTFTAGNNSGVSGPVNSFTNPGAFAMRFPFPAAVQVGDTFTVYPGCDKLEATCQNNNSAVGPAFNNGIHFSGTPFVPVPETLYDGNIDNPPAQQPGSTAGTVVGSLPSAKNVSPPYKT